MQIEMPKSWKGTNRVPVTTARLIEKVETFLKFNPTRREATFIRIDRRGTNSRARAFYRSNQGLSYIAHTYGFD